MATHALTTSRRAVLALPLAIADIAGVAAPCASAAKSCTDLGLELGRRRKAYQEADRLFLPDAEQQKRFSAIQAASAALSAAPVVTVGDVQAKALLALERMNWARDNCEDVEPVEEAATMLREVLFALQRLSGVTLCALGADFVDFHIGQAIRSESACARWPDRIPSKAFPPAPSPTPAPPLSPDNAPRGS